MKPVANHAGAFEAPGQRQNSGHGRQIRMELGVEAGDLGKVREAGGESLDQLDFHRQVVGIERADSPELGQKMVVDSGWLPITWPAVNDAMPDRHELSARLEPIQQPGCRVRRRHVAQRRIRLPS